MKSTLIGGVMKKLSHIAAVISVAAFAAFTASALAAPATTSVAFKATYTGKATEKVSGQNVTAVAKGTGKASVLGKSSISGTAKGSTAQQCTSIIGPGKITSAKGNLNVTLVKSRGCAASQEEQNSITLSGYIQIKNGTGKFAKAKGKIHFSGHYDRTSGAFTVNLTGKLTY
jgi:hypothetical protein